MIRMHVWQFGLAVGVGAFVFCFLAFAAVVWLSGRLDRDLTDLDFDAHARDAVEQGDGR